MNIQERIASLRETNPFLNKEDIVYNLVLEDILNWRLKSGERVNQEELSSQYNISRSPVREALYRLEVEGYLGKNNKGYYVYRLKMEDYLSINEFRIMFEAYGTRLAAKSIKKEEIQQLKFNMQQMKSIVEQEDMEAFLKLDEEFHLMLIYASKNPYLIKTYLQYKEKFHFFRILTTTSQRFPATLAWHEKIYTAVISNNEERAARTAIAHLQAMIKTASIICQNQVLNV